MRYLLDKRNELKREMKSTGIKAVLFDLDDTLFDHQHSSRSALRALRQTFNGFRQTSIEELEVEHARLLEKYHQRVIRGRMSLKASREERFRELLQAYGESAIPTNAEKAAKIYSEIYLENRRATPGAIALLEALHPQVKTAIISNHLVAEQIEKIQVCGLTNLLDEMIISEEAGVAKPHPSIFKLALQRLGTDPRDVVMVGDNWENDILGAANVGIPNFWLNRYNLRCPNPAITTEIHALEPLEPLLEQILNPIDPAKITVPEDDNDPKKHFFDSEWGIVTRPDKLK